MNYIMIEDNEHKKANFEQYISEEDTLLAFKSYCSGLIELKQNPNYDVLILDMNFFWRDDDYTIERNIGLYVLSEMKRRKIDLPVVIYSSDDTVDVSEYPNVIDYLVYNPSLYIKNRVNEIKENVLIYKRKEK